MAFLEIKNISKSYEMKDSSLLVIDNFSYTAEKGDLISLTGPSGAGKSTLLHMIGALDKPTKGNILFNGEDLYSKKESELNLYRGKHMGFIFQFHYLLDDFSAIENIMMPMLINNTPKDKAYEKAIKLIDSVGLLNRKDHFPNELSGGEQQRIAVARALSMSPDIILADEPTGNLDKANSLAVLEILKKQAENGVCVIIVTHDDFIASECIKHITMQKL